MPSEEKVDQEETIRQVDHDLKDLEKLNLTVPGGTPSRRHSFAYEHRTALLVLLTLLFLFGFLATPTPPVFVSQETPVLLDTAAPRVVNPELSQRLLALFQGGATEGTLALLPDTPTQATVPTIHTWTPNALGKLNADGTIVPVTGTYSIPGGWYGAIRLLSDGREIGKTFVDARSHNTPMGGSFLITPIREEGQHTVHLVFDATKSCRIACAPGDQLCQAREKLYCTAKTNNQSFLSYMPVAASPEPVLGSCTTKTFVAGPKFVPQAEEDYTMCEKLGWGNDPVAEAEHWLLESHGREVNPEDMSALSDSVTPLLRSSQGKVEGSSGKLRWEGEVTPGNIESKKFCFAQLTLTLSCIPEKEEEEESLENQASRGESENEGGGLLVRIVSFITFPNIVNAAAIPGVCGLPPEPSLYEPTGVDACSSGTYQNRSDLQTKWRWRCLGYDGGATANCVLHKTPADYLLTPNGLDFGIVPIGMSVDRSFTIQNVGAKTTNGVISPLPTIGGGAYSCIGGCNFILTGIGTEGDTVTKTIRLTASGAGDLGGTTYLDGSYRADGAPPVPLLFSGTGVEETEIEVFDQTYEGIIIPSASYSIPIGDISETSSPLEYDFVINNIGASGMEYDVSIVGGPQKGYSLSGDCTGVNIANSDPDRTCTVHFDPSLAGGVGSKDVTIQFDNTTTPGGFVVIRGLDPILIDFTAEVKNGPIAQVLAGVNPSPNVIVTSVPGGYDIDFRDVVFNTAQQRLVHIFNNGDLPMDVSYGAVATPHFSLPGNTTNDIPQNGTEDLLIDFHPQTTGVITETFSVATDGYVGGTMNITLRGNAVTSPDMRLSPLSGLDFGAIDLPEFDTKTLTIFNDGDTAMTVSLTDASPDFVLPGGGGPFVIPGLDSRAVDVIFTPSVVSSYSNTIHIEASALGWGGEVEEYPVFGEGSAPPFNIVPLTLDFGRALINSTKVKNFIITNNDTKNYGTVDLSSSDPYFTCVSPSPCQIDLPIGGSTTITVEFHPLTMEMRVGQLLFSGGLNGIDGFSIPVIGEGIRPQIRYTPGQ